MDRCRRILSVIFTTLLLGSFFSEIAPTAAVEIRCFTETDTCVGGRFLAYWQEHGGLARNGYPISDELTETLEDGNEYTVQYFERVRLEYHPENAPPDDVLLGQLGRYVHPADPPARPIEGSSGIGRYFRETGHNVRGGFFRYWLNNGGLVQFGYPLSEASEETLEDGQVYLVQYFERARMEYHPENAGTPYAVLLGQLGRGVYAARGR